MHDDRDKKLPAWFLARLETVGTVLQGSRHVPGTQICLQDAVLEPHAITMHLDQA